LTSDDFASDKPNILVIMGDDIGLWNVSAYSQGMMGYQTPNIDRIANEGGESTSGDRGRSPARAPSPQGV
jgi:arylsulfatase A-like enzyme